MLGSTAVLLIQNGTYVLQQRDDKPSVAAPNTYSAWGGAIEPEDDSVEQAAAREVLEETGIVCHPGELISLGSQITDDAKPENIGQKSTIHYFYLQIPQDLKFSVFEGQGKITVKIPYSRATLAKEINEYTLEAIRRYEAAA